MFDRRRYLGTFAVFALVLLRLVVGWHFFREGTQKIEYDRRDGEFRLAFTSEGFLNQAKGPLARLYRSQAPGNHGWRELLAAPRKNVRNSEPETTAAHQDWMKRIAADWQATLDKFTRRVPTLNDDQKRMADEAFSKRIKQVEDYLASEADAIAEYRHEVWRLENWRNAPEAGEVPFHDERIAVKSAETSSRPTGWVNQIRAFETDFHNDLSSLLSTEQRERALTSKALNDAFADPRQKSLRTVDLAVTALTIGVGVCLLLGFFTRLASLAGALFLLAVIASQPPWIADAVPTMPNIIEFASLLVLAGTRAGRWAGLDYFTYALFNRRKAPAK